MSHLSERFSCKLTNRCFSGSEAVKSSCCINAIEIYSIQTGKQSVVVWGLLYDIRMSVVQERVHTSARFPNTPRGKERNEKKQNKTQKNCVQCDTKVKANEV